MYTENFKVHWKHEQYLPKAVVRKQGEEVKHRDMTTCFIEIPGGAIVSQSTVRQFHKDAPNRRAALKESFKRAAGSTNITKEQRKELWEGFKAHNSKCLNC